MRLLLRLALLVTLVGVAGLLPVSVVQAVHVPQTLSDRRPAQAGPVEPGFAIGHLGVLWAVTGGDGHGHEEHGQAAVRFRHDDLWGVWIPLIEDGADRDDLWASGLVAGDGAEAYQLRGLPPHAVAPRVVALNTTDGPPRRVAARPAAVAQAIDGCVSRAEWGADESLRHDADGNEIWPPAFHDPQVMTVHHTATGNDDADPAATVRAIYEYHAVDQGWGDIGYQYLVDESGRVYEGRWSGSASTPCAGGGDGADFAHESAADAARVVTAAHTAGWNSGNVGVALLGDFRDHPAFGAEPKAAAVAALEHVLAELAGRHGIDPQSTVTYVNPVSGETKAVDAIAAHRDYTATECPGERLYDDLPEIRAAVAALLPALSVTLTAPTAGATVSATVQLAADASASVTAVTFSVEGVDVASDGDGTDGWTATWDSTTVADGTVTITATATDGGASATDSVGVTVDNVEDPAPESMHVADLDASSRNEGRTWSAQVTVGVVNSAGAPVSGATVSGAWTGHASGATSTCTTDGGGRCSVELTGVRKQVDSVVFTVTDVTGALAYDATANSDPDGDSDGTRITIGKP